MFERVLTANRGAVAVRIARTLERMGVHSIGAAEEDDARVAPGQRLAVIESA